MSGTFSDKTWSGTPMWQIADELEEQRRRRDEEERRKASTPVAVLNTRQEGSYHLCELVLLIPSLASVSSAAPDVTASAGGFREVKIRGPRRQSRREAMKDGFELRTAFHKAGEAEVRRRHRELQNKTWKPQELPLESAPIEEKQDREQRLRLAQRPRGTGWSRKKDAEFFVHTHAPMAYDPKKMQYFTVEPSAQQYVPCDPPHDPTEYQVTVNAGASLVGKSDADLVLPERPRSLLLKQLVQTGAAMKKPLFFLDQPASCFALFEGLRGNSAVDYCSRNFHTKLLSKMSGCLQYWTEAMVESLLQSIFEELDAEILQQGATCYDGVSVAVALVLGDRLTVAHVGAVRSLLVLPSGETRVLGDPHNVAEEGPERQRVDAACGEVVRLSGTLGAGVDAKPTTGPLAVRRPLQARETSIAADQAAELQRVLECAPDCFAALGFTAEDVVDAKAAKAQYRKIALKVHPDKAPEDLKDRAKEAFAKVEATVERIEALCEASAEATAELQRLLDAASHITAAVMPRSWAYRVVGAEEGAEPEDVEKKVAELKKTLAKLGQFTDGRLAQPDAARASRLLDEALEVLSAPAPRAEGSAPLDAVPVTRALGLRDLKRPRPIVTATPQLDVVQLDATGGHHIVLLSSAAAAALDDVEVVQRLRTFPRQPKLASLVVAQDAAMLQAQRGASPSRCLASSVVSLLQVGEEKPEIEQPVAKKARTEPQGDKVRCLHILLKHKDLKMTRDMDSQLRLKGKGPVTRTLAQTERELLEMQKSLAANPNIFHVLARKHSECDTALQPGQSAGDLGWVARGTSSNPQFEAAMFALKIFEVSDIVTTPRGLHIIQRIA